MYVFVHYVPTFLRVGGKKTFKIPRLHAARDEVRGLCSNMLIAGKGETPMGD